MRFDLQFFGTGGSKSGINRGHRGGSNRTVTYSDLGGIEIKLDKSGRLKTTIVNEKKNAVFREIMKAPIGTKITAGGTIGGKSDNNFEIKKYRGGKGIASTDTDVNYAFRRGYKLSRSSLYTVIGNASKITIEYPKESK